MKAVNVLRIRKHWGKACGAGRLEHSWKCMFKFDARAPLHHVEGPRSRGGMTSLGIPLLVLQPRRCSCMIPPRCRAPAAHELADDPCLTYGMVWKTTAAWNRLGWIGTVSPLTWSKFIKKNLIHKIMYVSYPSHISSVSHTHTLSLFFFFYFL